MGTKDFDFFLENPDEFDKLSVEDQAKVFGGGSIEGEISSDPPDAAAQTESEPEGGEEAPEQSNSADKPAVLAKDGKHLIPFEELENAREQARQWKQLAEEASALAEHLKNTGQQQTPDESASGKEGEGSIDLDNLEMQAEEASLAGDMDTYRVLRKQINSEVERRAASRAIEALQEREARERQRAIETAVQAEASKAIAQYPFLDHLGSNPNWEAIAQVQALRDLYAANGSAIDKALADAVAKVALMYAEPKKSAPAEPEDVAAKAAAAIAKAKAPAPNSMSSIPSASIPHHDEADALLDMGSNQLNEKFMSMAPDQIERVLARLL